MNCTDVEPFLDRLARDFDGSEIPDEMSLRLHFTDCSSCQRKLRLLERWDHRLSRAMTDVAVPEGMTNRLTIALQGISPVDPLIAPIPSKKWALNHRFRVITMIAAGCLFVASLWWTMIPRASERLSATNVASLWERIPEATPTDSALIKKLPHGWSSLDNISLQDWNHSTLNIPRLTVSVKPFELRFQRSEPEAGSLFAIPKSRWAPVPVPALSVSQARVQYSSDHVWIVWAEGDVVYILAMTGSPQSLERLQRQLSGDHAVF